MQSRRTRTKPRSSRPTLTMAFVLLAFATATSFAETEENRPEAPGPGTVLTGARVTATRTTRVNFRDIAERKLVNAAAHPWRVPLNEEGEKFEAEGIWAIAPSIVLPPPVRIDAPSPSPTISFKGLDDIPVEGTSFGVIPPDVDGAVGTREILMGLNNNYRVISKGDGATIATVALEAFWASTGAGGVFDPKTLYDPYNNRWIVCALSDGATANSSILVGVSDTDDPNGSYTLARIDADAGNTLWADFPTIGINKNWIAVNVNMFTIAGGYSASKCLVIDYPQFRAGTVGSTFFSGTGFTASPAATYSTTENTLYVPTHLNSGSGTYRVDRITGTSSSPTYTIGTSKSRGLTWNSPGSQVLPQKAPTGGASACGATPCKIECTDPQLRSTPVVRNGFIYYTQTIGLGSGASAHTGIQWTKLDAATQNVLDGGRIEDPTATATNGGKWYAYPHIAANSVGDILVGFSQFASNQYGAAGYAIHLAADPAGSLRDPLIYKAGEDYYHKDFGSGRNRWGDYAKAQVDPADDRSLWMIAEYAKVRAGTDDGSGNNSSRWGTWIANVGGPPPPVTITTGAPAVEGDSEPGARVFTVHIPSAYSTAVIVNYQTHDGTAEEFDLDYQPTAGTATIPAGAASAMFTVDVFGDTKFELDETFTVSLTTVAFGTIGSPSTAAATIVNDDPPPALSIDDVTHAEGGSGTTTFTFQVSMSAESGAPAAVDYQAVDSTATLAGSDFAVASGTLMFDPSVSVLPLSVQVQGDLAAEPDEVFVVNLSNPTGASIADGHGTGTIQNDDGVTAVATAAPVTEFAITRIVPNPTRGGAAIDYAVAREAVVSLTVHDLQGRTVATLERRVLLAGRHRAQWNARDSARPVADGVYFVCLRAAEKTIVRRLLVAH